MKMEGNSNFSFWKKLKQNGMEWKEIATPVMSYPAETDLQAIRFFSLPQSPNPGQSFWCKDESNIDELEGSLKGPPDSPFEDGLFKLKITIPERYPFEPPQGQKIMITYTYIQVNLFQKLFFFQNMLCTKIVLNIRNNFCTQHVLPFDLEIFMY